MQTKPGAYRVSTSGEPGAGSGLPRQRAQLPLKGRTSPGVAGGGNRGEGPDRGIQGTKPQACTLGKVSLLLGMVGPDKHGRVERVVHSPGRQENFNLCSFLPGRYLMSKRCLYYACEMGI